MQSTHSIHVLPWHENKAHITELIRLGHLGEMEKTVNPLKKFFKTSFDFRCYSRAHAALARAICPSGPAAFNTSWQQSI